MKVFERIVLVHLQAKVYNYIDPLQFAYRKNRGVDDVLLHLLNNVYSHLEKKGSSIRLMFYDFSSAFNTIQPHLMARKLSNMNINSTIVLWILDYLTNRPQFAGAVQASAGPWAGGLRGALGLHFKKKNSPDSIFIYFFNLPRVRALRFLKFCKCSKLK